MCGIVGLFSKSDEVGERLGEHLGAMLGQMGDRGPDSAGVAVYRDPAPAGSSKVTLFSPDPRQDWAALHAALETSSATPSSRRSSPATRCSSSAPTPARRRRGCVSATPRYAS